MVSRHGRVRRRRGSRVRKTTLARRINLRIRRKGRKPRRRARKAGTKFQTMGDLKLATTIGTGKLIPRKKYVSLEYNACTTVNGFAQNANNTLALGTSQTVMCNNPYDPCVALSGAFNESAALFRFYSQFYNLYCVESATVEYTFTQLTNYSALGTTVDNGVAFVLPDPMIIGIKYDPDNTLAVADWATRKADPTCKQCLFQPTTEGGNSVTLRHRFNLKKDEAQPELGNSLYAGYTNGSPTNKLYFVPYFQNATRTTATCPSFAVTCRLVMRTLFSDKKDLVSTSLIAQE